MTNRISTLLLFFLASTQLCFSQSALEKAQKQYALQNYNEAINLYQDAYNGDSDNLTAILGLARSYGKMDDYLESVKLFALASAKSNLVKSDLILYGNILRKMANYDEARLQYEKVKLYDNALAKHYILSCDYAEHMLSAKNEYEIRAFASNSSGADYAIRSNNKSLFWMIASKDSDRLCPTELTIKGDIMKSFQSDDVIPIPRNTDCFIMTDYASNEDISVMMQPNGHGIHPLSLENANGHLKIISSNNGNPYEESFPYNELGYSLAFPQLTEEGTKLFFSSNIPGGYGGYDIYVSEKQNGEWSEPQNLGPVINSIGDEITPYYTGSAILFASNYLHGLGGFDLFRSESYNGKFTFPANLGSGVNSPQDDVFPFKQEETGMLYFSSNRMGSLGDLDIYFAYKKNEFPVTYLNENQDIASFELTSEIVGSKSAVELTENMDTETKPSNEKVSENMKLVKVNNSEWEGAMMIDLDESLWNDTPVYFIQLASVSSTKLDGKDFEGLAKYGNIYKMNASNMTKIRLGYFLDEAEARAVLSSVKKNGYSDAFITSQPLKVQELELLVSNASYQTDSYMVPKKFKGTSGYKVRLASYENPKWFNINKAKDIGKIEQWSKGGWTIFVLSGFSSQEEAAKARIKAINQGFVDAEVVFDNNGLLEKIQSN